MNYWSIPLMLLMLGLTVGFLYAIYGLFIAFQSGRYQSTVVDHSRA